MSTGEQSPSGHRSIVSYLDLLDNLENFFYGRTKRNLPVYLAIKLVVLIERFFFTDKPIFLEPLVRFFSAIRIGNKLKILVKPSNQSYYGGTV